MNPARIDALLDLARDQELPHLLRGLRVFQLEPRAEEWRRRILGRLGFLRLP